MKIATYNVNGVRSRLPNLLAWLERELPDVACLQELKAPDEAFPQAALRDAGYESVWHGQKSWNGVAILARGTAPEETRRGLPGDPDDNHSRYLEAIVHGVRIGCLYLPNGNPQPGPKFDYKLKWFERFNKHAAKLWKSGEPIVLCGDYNVVPTDFDIYNPASWRHDALLQPESRAAWARLLAQGWTDALRARFPNEKIYTFWDYFRQHWQRNSGLRIDHLLLSKVLAPKLLDAGVHAWVRGEAGASDHAPTWVQLDVPAAKRPPVRKRVSRARAAPLRQATQALLAMALASGAGHAHATDPAAAGARMMPPARLSCVGHALTSYFGKVTGYRRMKSAVWLRIATDFGTVEEVTVRDPNELDPARHFLYRGQPFKGSDWARIESKPGKLRAGTRATAWICADGSTPLVDWNGAAE